MLKQTKLCWNLFKNYPIKDYSKVKQYLWNLQVILSRKEKALKNPTRFGFHMHTTPHSYLLIAVAFITWLKKCKRAQNTGQICQLSDNAGPKPLIWAVVKQDPGSQ